MSNSNDITLLFDTIYIFYPHLNNTLCSINHPITEFIVKSVGYMEFIVPQQTMTIWRDEDIIKCNFFSLYSGYAYFDKYIQFLLSETLLLFKKYYPNLCVYMSEEDIIIYIIDYTFNISFNSFKVLFRSISSKSLFEVRFFGGIDATVAK